MVVFRGTDDSVCTGTPDNPCLMDEMSINVQLPPDRPAVAKRSPAKAVVGVALAATVVGVVLAVVGR